jgi:uncharacterized protein YuzB (UPF0349 family)
MLVLTVRCSTASCYPHRPPSRSNIAVPPSTPKWQHHRQRCSRLKYQHKTFDPWIYDYYLYKRTSLLLSYRLRFLYQFDEHFVNIVYKCLKECCTCQSQLTATDCDQVGLQLVETGCRTHCNRWQPVGYSSVAGCEI